MAEYAFIKREFSFVMGISVGFGPRGAPAFVKTRMPSVSPGMKSQCLGGESQSPQT